MRQFRAKKSSFLNQTIYNSKGVSLLEAVLAMSMVAVIALASISFFSDVSRVSQRSRETCRLYNLSFLERIRSYGAVASVANFTPMTGTGVTPANAPAFSLPPEVNPNNRWPGAQLLQTLPPAREPYINNSLLIDGYMNILQSLYNQYPNICNSWTTIGSTESNDPNALVVKYPEDLKEPAGMVGSASQIRIVPYDIDTGALTTSCGSFNPPLRVAPRGSFLRVDDPDAPFMGPSGEKKLTSSPVVRSDIGFAVIVRSNFINDQGDTDTCTTEGRFQYDIDMDAPPAPQVLSLTQNTAMTANCDPADRNRYTLNVGYDSSVPGNKIEPGTVLLCQDLSVLPTAVQPNPGPGLNAYYGMRCFTDTVSYNIALTGQQVSFNSPGTGYYPPPGYGGFDYSAATRTALVTPPKWVPCSQMTLCGKDPTTVANTSSAPGATPVRLSYQMIYDNLPSDCRIVVRVAGVDTAANPSTEANSPTYNDVYVGNTAAFIATWDVPRPRCGTFCPVGAWPNGYFTCGSC